MSWLQDIAGIVEREGAAARVVIIGTEGPTPRAVGASLLVSPTAVSGKIGRSEVEARAVGQARALMALLGTLREGGGAWLRERRRYSTGDVLGLGTGGAIEVLVEAFGPAELGIIGRILDGARDDLVLARPAVSGQAPGLLDAHLAGADAAYGEIVAGFGERAEQMLVCAAIADGTEIVVERIAPKRRPFTVYGTGLVARALIDVLAPLPFRVQWLDCVPAHFPAKVPATVSCRACEDLAGDAGRAEAGGLHAVMTASHDLDLAVCRALLRRGTFAYLGVIGSQVKRGRLVERLTGEGFAAAMLERVACPIGLPAIRSKVPAVIAVGVAAQALAAIAGEEDQAGLRSDR